MNYTEPIRDSKELRNFIDFYKKRKPDMRNYCLIVTGLNTALRISDILDLRWADVYDFDKEKVKEHIALHEIKTGKGQIIAVNKNLYAGLNMYINDFDKVESEGYVFESKKTQGQPISRIQAYRIIKQAAQETLADSSRISCHSLRKTFGYFAYKNGANPALLMSIYNHSSFEVTKRYLGINQDEKDSIYLSVKF